MKPSIFCLVSSLSFLALLRAAASAETSSAIPLARLGMEADKKGAAAASSITPTASGARLKAQMQDIEAEATPEGLWLTSTADEDAGKANRFRLRAVAANVVHASDLPHAAAGTAAPLSQTGIVRASQQAAVWLRPGLIEEYSVSSDGVRQDFVLIQRPSGAGNELAVDLEIAGAQAEVADYGVKLNVTATGRELAYSRLKVTDAAGKELTARFDIVNPERLRITVQDVGAVYPVRIDPTFSDADWVALNPGIPGANDIVRALAVDSSGNLFAGGEFTYAGSVAANRIAKWNGSGWSALGTGMDGIVWELEVIGSYLYAGGSFTTAGGTSVNRIAKWNGSVWSALGSGMNGGVVSLVAIGSDLYAGGNFTTAGGTSANYIAKWDGSTWSALGSGMSGSVSALAVIGSDLYAAGNFFTAGGSSANYIAKWNGVVWSALGSGLNDYVYALAVVGSDLYVGGAFSMAGGTSVSRIARWDGSGWSALGSGINGSVYTLAVSGSDLYAAGWFTTAGGTSAQNIAKWNGSAWSALGTGLNYNVYALAANGGNLYAGGGFWNAGGTGVDHIAKWSDGDWSALGVGLNAEVDALAVSGGDLYIGGYFTSAGGVSANCVAKWNGSVWSALGTGMAGMGIYTAVRALAINGNNLYAGGVFTEAGGTSARYIAKWDGNVWSALGTGMAGGLTYYTAVNTLVVRESDLYVGGDFTTAGWVAAKYIAKWDGSTWSTLGSGMNSYVRALAVSGSDLYAGGTFTTAGGIATNYIAKWDGNAWSALGTGINSYVYALAVSGSDIYAAGNFSSAGGTSAKNIAKWNGSAWSALGSGINDYVNALAVVGNDLYVGGVFTTAGGTNTTRIAKWNGSVWSALGSGLSGRPQPYLTQVSALAADASGHLFVGGEFLNAGATFSPYLAKADLPLTPLETWRRDHFGIIGNSGSAADTADADADGLSNLLEWAANLNPTTSSISPAVLAPNGADLEFTYPRSVPALNAGAVFTVEWSDTLVGGSWSTAGVIQTILSDNGTVQQVKATLPAGSGGKRFVRLRVTSPP